MTDKCYVIIPEDIEDGSQIIGKVYNQMCLINLLKNKNELVPPVTFKKLSFSELLKDDYQQVPVGFSEDEIELIRLYCQEEIAEFNKGKFKLPFPCFYREDLYRYDGVAVKLSSDSLWLIQLVRFFAFLTEEGYTIEKEGTGPEDFLYSHHGKIVYFTGYSKLALSKRVNSLLEDNLLSLAHLLYNFYINDTEKYDARLYQQNWFEKLEGRLIEPLLYGKYSAGMYNDFGEILLDLKGKKPTRAYRRKVKTAVFLDTANIFTPLHTGYSEVRIDFDKLLFSIYGKRVLWENPFRVAVMFLPTYQDRVNKDQKYNLLIEIKEDLESYGFRVVVVENKTARAKTINDGEVEDIDDMKLIEIMDKYKSKVERALLLSGDGHFYGIACGYRQAGKEIKIISTAEQSSSRKLVENFDHDFLYNYPDCLEFL